MKKLFPVIILSLVFHLGFSQQVTYDVTAGDGNGLRFWSSDHYKIHMGNEYEYKYGPVTDYSIKMNMSTNSGRGWTWGIEGQVPVAALNNSGQLQIAGSFVSMGNVGIGTATPSTVFHIEPATGTADLLIKANSQASVIIDRSSNGVAGDVVFRTDGADRWRIGQSDNGNFGNGTELFIGKSKSDPKMVISAAGSVGIGTTAPDSKLTVKGVIHAEEVKVDLAVPGPDYVFDESYPLRSLEDTKAYIDQNKHLPGIPSSDEMQLNGVNLLEMNMKLLEKVEELTLHLIEMKRENEEQQKQLNKLLEKSEQ